LSEQFQNSIEKIVEKEEKSISLDKKKEKIKRRLLEIEGKTY